MRPLQLGKSMPNNPLAHTSFLPAKKGCREHVERGVTNTTRSGRPSTNVTCLTPLFPLSFLFSFFFAIFPFFFINLGEEKRRTWQLLLLFGH